jgi:tRNA G46 methylase TrmB
VLNTHHTRRVNPALVHLEPHLIDIRASRFIPPTWLAPPSPLVSLLPISRQAADDIALQKQQQKEYQLLKQRLIDEANAADRDDAHDTIDDSLVERSSHTSGVGDVSSGSGTKKVRDANVHALVHSRIVDPLQLFDGAPGLPKRGMINQYWLVLGVPHTNELLTLASSHPHVGMVACEPLRHRTAALLTATNAGIAIGSSSGNGSIKGANIRIYNGEALPLLSLLPSNSVHRIIINSPPVPRLPSMPLKKRDHRPYWKIKRDEARREHSHQLNNDPTPFLKRALKRENISIDDHDDDKDSNDNDNDNDVDGEEETELPASEQAKAPSERRPRRVKLLTPSSSLLDITKTWPLFGRILSVNDGTLVITSDHIDVIDWLRDHATKARYFKHYEYSSLTLPHHLKPIVNTFDQDGDADSAAAANSSSSSLSRRGEQTTFVFTRVGEEELLGMQHIIAEPQLNVADEEDQRMFAFTHNRYRGDDDDAK